MLCDTLGRIFLVMAACGVEFGTALEFWELFTVIWEERRWDIFA